MSTFRGVARQPVVFALLRGLLALCVVVLVGSPLLPHDPACHVKARTDCTACTLQCASGDVRAHTAPGATLLTPRTEGVFIPVDSLTPSLALAPTSGRAPPA
jgi:hypothetical protein